MSKRKAGRIMLVFGIILLFLSVLVCLPATLPRAFEYQIYTAISGEMAPEVPEDSLVYVKTKAGESIEPGDMAAYYSATGSGAALGHVRENNKNEEKIVVSDISINADVSDKEETLMEVTYAQLLGTTRVIIPHLGFFMNLIASSAGMVVLSIIIGLSIILSVLGIRLQNKSSSKIMTNSADEIVNVNQAKQNSCMAKEENYET